ncbi:hypothetical protein SGPA1_21722 [Streptomyces misionensis JCM 4497]
MGRAGHRGQRPRVQGAAASGGRCAGGALRGADPASGPGSAAGDLPRRGRREPGGTRPVVRALNRREQHHCAAERTVRIRLRLAGIVPL